MSGNKSKLIAFNYFGGKFQFCHHLYTYFPHQDDFTHLVDVFGGSFAVSLNYTAKDKLIRTANEINGDITNFFTVLRDKEDELIDKLLKTPCSMREYNNCWERSDDPVESARRFYVRVRQSFFGLGASRKNKGWHMSKTRCNAKGGETVSKWNNAIPKLHKVAEALRSNFQITNYSYQECISKIDFDKAFFYLDPPYSRRSRASYGEYAYEFTDQDHEELADFLKGIQGKAMISGYDCSLMNALYNDWRKVLLPKKKNNIRSGEVQEVIWMNY